MLSCKYNCYGVTRQCKKRTVIEPQLPESGHFSFHQQKLVSVKAKPQAPLACHRDFATLLRHGLNTQTVGKFAIA